LRHPGPAPSWKAAMPGLPAMVLTIPPWIRRIT
jgi:hypothetical protein